MGLPLVNVFCLPYESWSARPPTFEEIQEHFKKTGYMLPLVNDSLKARISNHFDAATYMANNVADNGLENFVDRYLDHDPSYKYWRQCMPSKTPIDLSNFQKNYPNYISSNVDSAINNIGHTISEGQYLFHGGLWPNNGISEINLTLPFSTSLCPQIALRNAEWKGKAHDAGQIDLFVMRAVSPNTNVFVFRRKGTKMGNEKELLFSSGAKLVLHSRTLIRNDYAVRKYNCSNKTVPIYVIEVDIS